MINSDLLPDEQAELQTAFYRSHTFKGKELFPFSEGRRANAQLLGVKLFNGKVQSEGDNGMYPGFIADCHIILWLCSNDYRAIVKAISQGDESAKIAVAEWADENISLTDYEEMLSVVTAIIQDAFSARVKVVTGDEDTPSGN